MIHACGTSSPNSILNFLFDGVPTNDTTAVSTDRVTSSDSIKSSSKGKVNESIAPVIYLHSPYEVKLCSNCHDTNASNKKIMVIPDLCYQCHEDFQTVYKNIHYPVAEGLCIDCHDPHQSKYTKLLQKPVRELCSECHDLTELLSGDIHEEIEEAACTECHSSHGSNEAKLLK